MPLMPRRQLAVKRGCGSSPYGGNCTKRAIPPASTKLWNHWCGSRAPQYRSLTAAVLQAAPSNPLTEFMVNVMRCAPVLERIDRAQLARELLAQQFEGELGQRSRRHGHAPDPERIDRAQLARELLAQQFEGELGHRSRRHQHPKFVVVVAPVFLDGRAHVLRVHLDRAVVLKRQIYGAKLDSLSAGDFNCAASHAAFPRKIPRRRPWRPRRLTRRPRVARAIRRIVGVSGPPKTGWVPGRMSADAGCPLRDSKMGSQQSLATRAGATQRDNPTPGNGAGLCLIYATTSS